ncbi:MAG TPA: DUF3995 domain-containing protein [Ktedonosporobacter sp.]|nr:DUF3995 domain-containing protein [Ktedonosporobacter sp.]
MNEQVKQRAGIVLAVFLAADGLANLYWAMGNTWPAPDAKSLTLAILNANVSTAPQITVPLACLSFCGALIALARVDCLGKFGQLIPDPLLQLGILVIAAALLLRGGMGIGWSLGLVVVKTQLFYMLNLVAYTPICLLFFAVAVVAARSERSHNWRKS